LGGVKEAADGVLGKGLFIPVVEFGRDIRTGVDGAGEDVEEAGLEDGRDGVRFVEREGRRGGPPLMLERGGVGVAGADLIGEGFDPFTMFSLGWE